MRISSSQKSNIYDSHSIVITIYSIIFFVLSLAYTTGAIEHYLKIEISGINIGVINYLWHKIDGLFTFIPTTWYRFPLMLIILVFVLPYILGLVFRVLTFYRIKHHYSVNPRLILYPSLLYITYLTYIFVRFEWLNIMVSKLFILLYLFPAFLIAGLTFSLYALCSSAFLSLSKLTLRDILSALDSITTETSSSSKYSSSYSSSSSSSYIPNYTPEMSFSDKEAYIRDNSNYLWSTSAIERIENDSSLTDSQKDQLKDHLRIWGD